jgi:hypothetical protein
MLLGMIRAELWESLHQIPGRLLREGDSGAPSPSASKGSAVAASVGASSFQKEARRDEHRFQAWLRLRLADVAEERTFETVGRQQVKLVRGEPPSSREMWECRSKHASHTS